MNSNVSGLLPATHSSLHKLKLLLLCIVCSLASCSSGGGSSNVQAPPSDLTDSPIAGRWTTPCNNSNGVTSSIEDIEFFTDGTFTRTISGYFDLGCSVAFFDGTTTGLVVESIGMELPDRGVIRNVDFVTNTYSFIPRSDEAVLFFNSQATCGITNWEVDVDYDLSSCTNRPGDELSRRPTPFTDFTIYLAERGLLYYGNTISFTAENRPNTLSTIPALVRTTGAIGDEFPQSLRGFWFLPEANQYVELLDRGLIRFYSQTQQGCFDISFVVPLFSLGDDRYQDPFRIFSYTIRELGGDLLITFGAADSQAFTYIPSAVTVSELDLCT